MRTAMLGASVAVLLITSGSAAPSQTAATGRLMREKMTHSQRILEAIMISDYGLLDRESAALLHATEAPGWWVLKSPEYAAKSSAFVRETQDLVESAQQRDLDAAAMHYVSLTLTCYQCHRYLKNSRIAPH